MGFLHSAVGVGLLFMFFHAWATSFGIFLDHYLDHYFSLVY
jgi:hypothetical protein